MATEKSAPAEQPDATVQARVDKELDQGYRGIEVDPTPNEHYTVGGVLAGKPTPETDDDAAEAARKRVQGIERGEHGVI